MSTASVTDGGLTVSSNVVSEEQIRAELSAPVVAETTETPAAEPITEIPAELPDADRNDKGQFQPKLKSEKPRHNPQARVQEATSQAAEARREADEAKREAAEAKAELAKLRQPVAPAETVRAAEPPTRPEPMLEQFQDKDDPYAAWLDARQDWKLEQRDAKIARESAERVQEQAQRAAADRMTKAKATMPDLDEKITAADAALVAAGFASNGLARWPPALLDAVLHSEQSAELVHYLGSHPEECVQWAEDAAALPPSAATAVRRLLEKQLVSIPSSAAERSTGPAAAVLPRAQAQPITPVRSGSPATMGGPPGDNATAAEHAAYYNRIERESRRRPA